MSSGWVGDACGRVEQVIVEANTAITDAIAEAGVAHFDDSVTRVKGKNHWMHTAATATLTAFHIDQHGRGVASITAFGILPRFAGVGVGVGVGVHDAYLGYGYNGFTGATHALCNAHAVRELVGIGEFDPAARDDGWTVATIDLLGDVYRWVGAWRSDGHDKLPEFNAADLRRRSDQTLERALAVHPPRRGRQSPAGNLALRLRDRREEFLHFTTDFPVAFSNCAEQAIRMIKSRPRSAARSNLDRRPDLPGHPRLHLHRRQERTTRRRRAPQRASRQPLDAARLRRVLNSHGGASGQDDCAHFVGWNHGLLAALGEGD